MLKKSELIKIKNLLENSQNPLFFFDNDVDGLCSFLLLQRAIGRGKGIVIKSFPDLDETYLKRIDELSPDAVFILDKPRVKKEFITSVLERGLPLTWIDHHNVQNEKPEKKILEKIHYFNSAPSSEPTTYLAHSVYKRKKDIWIAMIGCVGDGYKPDFSKEFTEKYPELFNISLTPFQAHYTTEIGRAIKLLNFGLKDTTTNVVNLIKFLTKANSIYKILEENQENKQLYKRYNEINKVYERLIEKATKENSQNKSKLFWFSYSGTTSMTSEISNELFFKNQNKLVVIVNRKPDRANISIRGNNAHKIVLKAIKNIQGATGGGHEKACGASVPPDKIQEFREKIETLLNQL